ncbi:MAG: hypothetical protein ACREJB_11610, partial [Planctomycetaceae bacterium]
MPDLGISGDLNVGFRIECHDPAREPQFHVVLELQQGRMTHAILPFPLHDLTGKIVCDNQQTIVEHVSARNGITQLSASGSVLRNGGDTAGRFTLNLSGLVLDERIRGRLPSSLRRLFDSLHPSGRVDVAGTLLARGDAWRAEEFLVTVKDASAAHAKFPYPLTSIDGTIRQLGPELLEVTLTGQAGRRPAVVRGFVRNPGPEAEVDLLFRAERIPVDGAVREACPPELQQTWDALDPSGLTDVDLRIYRPPGLDQKTQQTLVAHVSDGSLKFEKFPYRVNDLQGVMTFTSADGRWTFRELSGTHGTAQLTGSGSFVKPSADGPGTLDLTIVAQQAAFDESLYSALSPQLRAIWHQLSPSGSLGLICEIDWTQGERPSVHLPRIEAAGGSMRLRAFPYPLHDVAGTFSWQEGLVTIHEFAARHDQTRVRADGWAKIAPDGEWRLRLTGLTADDVYADREFRHALPPSLRQVIESFNPQGPVSIARGVLEFRGAAAPGDALTAGWDIEVVHSGGTVTAGPELKNVFGSVTARGTWDGRHVKMSGYIDLDSVEVLDHQLTQVRGPYTLEDLKLVLGGRDAVPRPGPSPIPRAAGRPDLITAQFIDGELTLSASADFQENGPVYDAHIALSQGQLQKYARRYLPRQGSLWGI